MNNAFKYDIIEDYEDENNQDDLGMIKSLCEISVYDLGATDHCVWLKKNKKFGFDLEIENDEEQSVYKEEGIHPYALESIASFCRRFLHGYNSVMDKE